MICLIVQIMNSLNSSHSLYHLQKLPPYRTSDLRARGHTVKLPECVLLTGMRDLLLSELCINMLNKTVYSVVLFYCSYHVFIAVLGVFLFSYLYYYHCLLLWCLCCLCVCRVFVTDHWRAKLCNGWDYSRSQWAMSNDSLHANAIYAFVCPLVC